RFVEDFERDLELRSLVIAGGKIGLDLRPLQRRRLLRLHRLDSRLRRWRVVRLVGRAAGRKRQRDHRYEQCQWVSTHDVHWTPTLAALAAALPPEGEQFAPWDGPA